MKLQKVQFNSNARKNFTSGQSTELDRIKPVMSIITQLKLIEVHSNKAGGYNWYLESNLKTFLIK